MARNPDQNRRMRDERRQRILSAALELFAIRGLAGTKTSHIAAKSQMSQGLLYHYFRSKEEIYVELVRHAFERMSEAARGLEAMDLGARAKVELALGSMLESMASDEDFARYFLLTTHAQASETLVDGAREVVEANRRVPHEVMRRIFEAGQEEGSVREHDPAELALLFWTTVKGLALHRAASGSEFVAPSLGLICTLFFEET